MFAEISDRILEQRLFQLLGDVPEQIALVTLRMAHLAEYLAVGADYAFNREAGAVGIVGRLHRRLFRDGINVLERHLSGLEKFFRKLFAHGELALAMADGYGVQVPGLH